MDDEEWRQHALPLAVLPVTPHMLTVIHSSVLLSLSRLSCVCVIGTYLTYWIVKDVKELFVPTPENGGE